MDAARTGDAYGCMPGHTAEQCDAEQAYMQAMLVCANTWVRIPRDQWPASWAGKYTDPVCPLVLALYGHPDSGGHWEAHCEKHLLEAGYVPIPSWRSCFWHPTLKLFLVVYVDDFKFSGPADKIAEGWELIRRHIKTDEPHPVDQFLGCKHVAFERKLPDTGVTVRGMEYDMESFLISCVERYKELTGVTTLRKATTPFLHESTKPDMDGVISSAEFEPDPDAAYAELLQYIEGGGETTATFTTGASPGEEGSDPTTSRLAPYAAKVLMKILYAARYARMDLLRAVCVLAQNVSRWTRDCDVKLYRLVCYINCSLHVRMTGWIGDNIDDLTVDLFADADFAGCTKTSRSTSGTHLSILGPNSCWPIAGQSKKQGCVSHSTPEAELVSADHAVRTYGTPALDLWPVLLH